MNNHIWQDDQPPYEEKKPWWRSPAFLVIGISILAILGLSFLWQSLSDNEVAGELPYIMAETGPEKVKPEDAGGAEIPHQDKKIYDLIDGSDGKTIRTVAVLESADQQIELPVGDTPASFSDATSLVPEEDEPKTVYNINSKVVNITEINDHDIVDKKTIQIAEKAKPDPEVAKKYRIQLASLPSETEAHKTIKHLKHKYKSLLKGSKVDIVSAMVRGKTMYRIQTGSFNSASEADNLCQKLKTAGSDCLVVKPSKN